jgi:membrane-anchored glycerophosphoryl diester phosphodiesterase (GDPDase)
VGRMVAGVVAVKVAADVILGHPVDIWGSYRLVLGKIVPLSVASILVGTVTGAAVFCFPVAIYFAMSWGLIFPVIVLEHQGGVEAMRRSWQLMRGRRWQLLLCMIVIGLVAAVLIGIPAALFGVAAGAGVVFWGGRFNVDSGILAVQLAQVVLQTLGETLFLAFSYILITRFYFDARVRNEAYDLELRLDRLARA